MIGDHKVIYQARSCDTELTLRRGGGVVTSILIYLLREGVIDEALVVTESDEDPWAKAEIVRTEEEIRKAAGSKYTFIDYKERLKDLGNRSAMVGLPCQLKLKRPPKIRIGLLCGLNLSPEGYDYLFRKIGIRRKDIETLDYRALDKDFLHITMKDGRTITLYRYWWLAYFFPYKKCIYCQDHTSQNSDMSVGDFKPGWSCVVARTQHGIDILNGANEGGLIQIEELQLEDFIHAKASGIYQKDVKGGYCKTHFVKPRGKVFSKLPLFVVRSFGKGYAKYLLRKSRRYFDDRKNDE